MYDKQNEAREFVADSRSEAVAEAARFFRTEEGELRISQFPESEVYGLGGRVAIVAAPSGSARVSSGGDSDDRGRGDRGGRERGGRERGGRERGGRERGGSDRGGRERGGRERGPRSEGGDRGGRSERNEAVSAEPAENSKGTARGDLGEVGQFLLGAVERMGLGPFEIEESLDGDFLILQLEGEAAIALGAGDGRGVDALQVLANQASMRTGDDAPRVVVDAEGSSEKREEFLSRVALRAAKRAAETERSVALEPMNARDRRIIHVALRDTEGVATISTGTDRYRQVVVVPEGSPEYDDARRSSEEANSRD